LSHRQPDEKRIGLLVAVVVVLVSIAVGVYMVVTV
jgi:hypothetical protein